MVVGGESAGNFYNVSNVNDGILGINQCVVQMDLYADVQWIFEYIVHEALERHWGVGGPIMRT